MLIVASFCSVKVHLSIAQTRIHIIISFLFMIGHHKLIPRIRINNIDALVSSKKLFFPPFFRIKVLLSVRTKMDSHNNLLSFHDWAPQTHSPHLDK